MVSFSPILGRSCHWIDTVIVGTHPSSMEQIERYECVISIRYNMWCGQSFWGRMSKQSAQILELLCCHLIFSHFSECLSLSFHLSLVCVLTVISGLQMAQTTSFMVFFFTYAYDALTIILMIGIISVHLWKIYGSHPWAHMNGRCLTLRLFRPPDTESMSTFMTIIQHSCGSPSYSSQRRKSDKMYPDQKSRCEALTVWRWHDTVHWKP